MFFYDIGVKHSPTALATFAQLSFNIFLSNNTFFGELFL